jgi:ubiquitin-like 1-activating enzyme E1 B
MEEMWKTRRAPSPLDYDSVLKDSSDAEARKQEILDNDQKTWALQENVIVFRDRYTAHDHTLDL